MDDLGATWHSLDQEASQNIPENNRGRPIIASPLVFRPFDSPSSPVSAATVPRASPVPSHGQAPP